MSLPGYVCPLRKGAINISTSAWISVVKELPASAVICIVILYIIYKALRTVLWFIIARRGVEKGYDFVEVRPKKLQLSKKEPSTSEKAKQETDKRTTEADRKVISFPNKKSKNQS